MSIKLQEVSNFISFLLKNSTFIRHFKFFRIRNSNILAELQTCRILKYCNRVYIVTSLHKTNVCQTFLVWCSRNLHTTVFGQTLPSTTHVEPFFARRCLYDSHTDNVILNIVHNNFRDI